VPVFWWERPFY